MLFDETRWYTSELTTNWWMAPENTPGSHDTVRCCCSVFAASAYHSYAPRGCQQR